MPRPKSELTGVTRHVGVRLIPAHYAEWKRLGGVKWLRQMLSESRASRERRKQNAHDS